MKKGTKSSGNKSQLIRDFATANPDMKPSQIIKELSAQGHKVYPALVSQALRGTPIAKKGRRKTRGKARVATGAKSATVAASFDVSNLKATSEFIRQSGSAEQAIESIKAYQKIAALFQ